MAGLSTRSTQITVPQRDRLVLLVLLPLIAFAGLALARSMNMYGPSLVVPIFGAVIALGLVSLIGLRAAFFLLVFALAVPFRGLWEGIDVHTTHVLVPLVAVLTVVQLAYGRLRLPHGFVPPLLLMLLGGVIAALAGPETAGALSRLLFGVALPMLVGIIAAALIVPRRDLGALSVVVAASVSAAGAIALAQAVGVAPLLLAPIDGERVNGMFFHPNILGAYLAAGTVILIAVTLISGKRMIPMIVPIMLGVGGLLVTVSRGPIVALVASLVVVLMLLSRRRSGRLLMFAVLAPLVFAVAIPETPLNEREKLQQRFQQTFQPNAESGRMVIWNEAAKTIEEHPLTGIGALTFTDVFSQTSTTPGINVEITHAHNTFLEGYLSLGPLGMIGFFWIVFGALRRLLVAARTQRDSPIVVGWSIGTVAAIFSFVVSGMVDFPFWQVEVLAFLFFLLGSAYAIGGDQERIDRGERPRAP